MKGKLWFSALLVGALGMLSIRAEAFVFSVCPSGGGDPLPNQRSGEPITWETRIVLVNHDFGDPLFNGAVLHAMDQWNQADPDSRFEFQSRVPTVGNPCDLDDEQVNASFRSELCTGDPWDDPDIIGLTLITALCSPTSSEIIDAGVLIKQDENWVVNDDSLDFSALDFRRVILHELGHVAGLGHPDEAVPIDDVVAIMRSFVSSLFELQDDDKNGIISLYKTTPSIAEPSGGGGGGGSADLLLLGGMFIFGWFRLRQRRTRANLSDGAS